MNINNFDNIFNYVFAIIFVAISLWGTYKLTRPYTPEKDKTELKCLK